MKINNYWKPKRKYIRKRKYNQTSNGTLTIRKQKEQRRMALLLITGFILIGIVQSVVMTTNTIHIDGGVVSKVEASKQVNQHPVKESLNLHSLSSRVVGTQEVKNEIRRQAKNYGVDVNTALAIARCESNFNPNAKNPTSTASGVWQFTEGTFLDGIKWRGLDWNLNDRFDTVKATDMAMWFIKRGEIKRWECHNILFG